MKRRKTGRDVAVGGAAVLAVLALWRLLGGGAGAPRQVVLGVSWKEAQALCLRSSYPIGDFFQRAQVWGVTVAFGDDVVLQDAVDQGSAFYFSETEPEEWRALGLIDPQSPLRPRQLWTRQPWLLVRVVKAAQAQGVSLSTQTAYGYAVAEIPPVLDLKKIPVGIAEPYALMLKSLGIYATGPGTAVPGEYPGEGGGGRGPAPFFEESVRDISVFAPERIRGLLIHHPGRWIRERLDPFKTVEQNLEGMRRIFQQLRSDGFSAAFSRQGIPQVETQTSWAIGFRRCLALAIGCWIPLWGLRAAFRFLRWTIRNPLWPLASPVWETVAAYGLSAVFVLFGGWCAHQILSLRIIQAGGVRLWESPFLVVFPLGVGSMGFFRIHPRGWNLFLRRILTVRDVLGGLFVILSAGFVWRHPFLWDFLVLWKEQALLLPALFVGLWLHFRRLNNSDFSPPPRAFLILGLAGLSFLSWRLSRPWAPFDILLKSAAVMTLWGAGIGLLGAVLLERASVRTVPGRPST